MWPKLKEYLKIETTEFDASITEFEERDGVFDKNNRVYDEDGLSPTLLANDSDPRIAVRCGASRGRGENNEQQLEIRDDEKTNTLTSVQKDNLVCIGNIYPNDHNSMAGRVYTDQGKSVTLSALGGGGGAKTGLYKTERRIRKLMPIECERLQTVPTGYTASASDSQRYRMLGNGWTVDVIAHILGYLPDSGAYSRARV